MSSSKITFKCAACGSAAFSYPTNPKPDDMVTCNGCGASSRYADVQTTALKEGERAVEKAIRDALKKPGFK